MNQSISKSIAIMRVIAMLYVVIILHYLPCYTSHGTIVYLLGQAFSFVGVGTFFGISGYLFGCQDRNKSKFTIDENKVWLQKRLRKVMLPYEIVVAAVIAVLLISGAPFSFVDVFFQVFNLQGLVQLKYGLSAELGHTWYMSIIVVCYLITPILRKANTAKRRYGIVSIFVLAIVTLSFCLNITSAAYTGNIMTYVLMYFIGRYKEEAGYQKLPCKAFGVLTLSLICRFAGWYFFDGAGLYNAIVAFCGTFAVIGYFYIGLWLFSAVRKTQVWKYVDGVIGHVNRISYEVYLVHAVLISGVCSLKDNFGGGTQKCFFCCACLGCLQYSCTGSVRMLMPC